MEYYVKRDKGEYIGRLIGYVTPLDRNGLPDDEPTGGFNPTVLMILKVTRIRRDGGLWHTYAYGNEIYITVPGVNITNTQTICKVKPLSRHDIADHLPPDYGVA